MANKATQFKSGNPGKPKGAVNKANKMVKDVVSQVFNDLQTEGGPSAKHNLKTWAKDNPKDFYLIAAKLIPVQMEHSGEMGITWNEVRNYGAKPKTDAGA